LPETPWHEEQLALKIIAPAAGSPAEALLAVARNAIESPTRRAVRWEFMEFSP
jgi:hypothetical protein